MTDSESPKDPVLGLAVNLLTEFGRGIASWAYVDSVLGEFLSWLMQADGGRMYAVTQSVSASTISGWIRTVAPLHFEKQENIDHINNLLADIDDARADRNAWIHGLWSAGPQPLTALVRTVRIDRAEMMKDELVTLSDLQGFTARARELHVALLNIGQQLGFLRPFSS